MVPLLRSWDLNFTAELFRLAFPLSDVSGEAEKARHQSGIVGDGTNPAS